MALQESRRGIASWQTAEGISGAGFGLSVGELLLGNPLAVSPFVLAGVAGIGLFCFALAHLASERSSRRSTPLK